MATTSQSSSILMSATTPSTTRSLRPKDDEAVPTWRLWAEAIATYASFAMLALVLLCTWLTLMEANAWI